MSKIAILTDSTSDIPLEIQQQKGIYVLPLQVHYKDKTYLDGIEITPDEVYSRLAEEVPTTSLPSGEVIDETFAKIKADGYTDVLAIHVSANLSGTFNFVNIVANEQTDLNIKMIDTKNVAMGLGMTVISASDYVACGTKTLDDAFEYMSKRAFDSRMFFSLNTFEYLIKGGRVGKVTGLLGSKLNLKPVMSCNSDGVYYTVAKAIGRSQSIKKLMDIAEEIASQGKSYNICVSHSAAFEEANALLATAKEKLKNAKNVYITNITPVLGVHAGPGLIGIGIEILAR